VRGCVAEKKALGVRGVSSSKREKDNKQLIMIKIDICGMNQLPQF